MKKISFIIILVMATLTTLAQTKEYMHIYHLEADEFMEIKECTVWKSEHIMITRDVDGKSIIALNCNDHIFTGEQAVKVALYDKNNEMIVVIDQWYAKESEDCTREMLVDNGFSTDSIPGAVKTGDRYMIPRTAFVDYFVKNNLCARFFTTTYGGYVYDYIVGIKPE